MTQTSFPWDGTVTGDADMSSYDQDEMAVFWSIMNLYDQTVQGVLYRNDTVRINGVDYDLSKHLEVTNPSGHTLRVASGAAVVAGWCGPNSANVDFTTTDDGTAITNPGAGTNYYRVVSRVTWADKTVRLAVLDVDTSAPVAVIQTWGDTWEVSHFTAAITAADVVTLTDTRVYAGPAHDPDKAYDENHPLDRQANDAIQADSGGDARGAEAVDLQQSRSNANEVASGAKAFIAGGEDNRASAGFAHAEGYGTLAGGTATHAEGYETEASGTAAHAEGQSTIASEPAAHAEGHGTEASGAQSHAEGHSTVASAARSHAEGYETTASGIAAHAEGQVTTAAGQVSHAGGLYASASMWGQFARTGNRFAAVGDAQFSIFALLESITHNDADWHNLTLDGASALISVATDQVMTFDIENDGGTTTMLASNVTTIYDTDDTDFDAQVVAGDTSDVLLLQVKDATSGGDTVRWAAMVRTAEVTFPA